MKTICKLMFGLAAILSIAFPFVPTEYHNEVTKFLFGDGTLAIASFFNYQFQQGQGIQPYLLKTMESVFGPGNTPAIKVDNLGFLNLLKAQDNSQVQMNRPTMQGPIGFINVKFKQRLVAGQTTTSDTCNSGVIINPWLETTVSVNNYRQVALMISDTLVQEYTDDLNKQGTLLGTLPPTPAMGEMVKTIESAANAILSGMNIDLLNLVTYGNNAVTGNNASKTINVDKDITQLSLTDGITQVLTEVQQNEFAMHRKPQVVGSGLWLNYFNQQAAKGLQFNGLNTPRQSNGFDFYYDQTATTILGTNQAAVFSPDDVQLVEFNRYTGPYAGYRATSYFGKFKLPIQMTENMVSEIDFDFQLRYIACPEDVAQLTDYYGASISGVYRGWVMVVSKYYGLFQPPTNAYRANDYLVNSNGVLRYTMTNN